MQLKTYGLITHLNFGTLKTVMYHCINIPTYLDFSLFMVWISSSINFLVLSFAILRMKILFSLIELQYFLDILYIYISICVCIFTYTYICVLAIDFINYINLLCQSYIESASLYKMVLYAIIVINILP
jgi:hypothetical protein